MGIALGDILIRPAGPADAEALEAVRRLTWRDAYASLIAPDLLDRADQDFALPWWHRGLARLDPKTVTLVAETRREGVVGFAQFGATRRAASMAAGEPAGEVYMLYVLPQAQGHGAGRRLMASTARVLTHRGLRQLVVWMLAGNHPAGRFYTALGGRPLPPRGGSFQGQPTAEAGFAWDDIALLTRQG